MSQENPREKAATYHATVFIGIVRNVGFVKSEQLASEQIVTRG